MVNLPRFPEPPPEQRDEKAHAAEAEVAEVILDAADLALDAADVSCEIGSCFDAAPDCAIVDCDPGCL